MPTTLFISLLRATNILLLQTLLVITYMQKKKKQKKNVMAQRFVNDNFYLKKKTHSEQKFIYPHQLLVLFQNSIDHLQMVKNLFTSFYFSSQVIELYILISKWAERCTVMRTQRNRFITQYIMASGSKQCCKPLFLSHADKLQYFLRL